MTGNTRKNFLLAAVVFAVAISRVGVADWSEKFLFDLRATPSRCELEKDGRVDVLFGYGANLCVSWAECRSESGEKYTIGVDTPAFPSGHCPALQAWPEREKWMHDHGHIYSEAAKTEDPESSLKRIRTFETLPNGLNCKFSSSSLLVTWAKQEDGSERPFCSGKIACFEFDKSANKWVSPKNPLPTVIGCSPKTKDNFRRGEVYCKESVRECFAEQKDFPVKQNVPVREDLRWDTLTGDPRESDASQFVASDKRTLANPGVGEKEVHAAGQSVDRKPQSEPHREALVLGRVR